MSSQRWFERFAPWKRPSAAPKNRFAPAERELRAYAVRALQTSRDVKRGERFAEAINFDILRPGSNWPGINPMRIDEAEGRLATRDPQAGDGIRDGDFARARSRG